MSRLRLILLVWTVCALLAAGVARAADPGAPPGSPPTWLPQAPWVLDHWLPYDAGRLYAALHASRAEVVQWLGAHDDHDPLINFARARGVPVGGLAARLVGPRRPGMSAALYRTLVHRAQLTLTQPHLMHHMLGHLMHVLALQRAMPRIFGFSLADIASLRKRGLSFAQIGALAGRPGRRLREQILSVLRSAEWQGVSLHQTPPSQARAWLALETKNLTSWLQIAPTPQQTANAARQGISPYCS